MKFHQIISIVLHPIVIPTISVLLYLAITPTNIPIQAQYFLVGIIFFSTYLVPLLFLTLLKAMGLIDNFKLARITERKIPLFLMFIVCYLLGKYLSSIPIFHNLGTLFYGTNIALATVYILFFLNIKTSLHVLSMSTSLGFFLMYCAIQTLPVILIATPIILLTGLLGSSRLHLKAHEPLEVYIAFFVGISTQWAAFLIL